MAEALQAYSALCAAASSPHVRAEVSPPEMLPHHTSGIDALTFKVSLAFDETDLEGCPDARVFLRGLREWAEIWEQTPEVEVLFVLPEGFSGAPVELRMLRPVLAAGTGGVQNGFFLGLPELYPRGWLPSTPLVDIVGLVRACLLGKGLLCKAPAEVRSDVNAFYTLDAYAATRRRVLEPCLDPSILHRSGFSHLYTVVSSHFAQYAMYTNVPSGFDAGGKALLPMHALELLMRSELREGLEAPEGTNMLGINLEAITGAGTPRGDALNTLLVGQDEAMTSEAAMIFAASSALEFPVFVGVREFTSPEPGVIIVPREVLENMGCAEGSVINLMRVDLPQVTNIVLQPHSSEFLNVEDTTGLPPREFLEQSFGKFSCLTPGETILVDGDIPGGREFRFTVVDVQPRSAVFPAGALFQGFSSQISIEFLPAVDTIAAPVTAGGADPATGEAAGQPGVGIYRGEEGGDAQFFQGGSAAPVGKQPSPSSSATSATSSGGGSGGGGGGGRRRLGEGSSGGAPSSTASSQGISSRELSFDPAAAVHLSPPSSVATPRVAMPPSAPLSAEELKRRRLEALERRLAAAGAASGASAGSAQPPGGNT
jgi:hypothetical protein